jgi:flagellar L-ring protein precursor FlgH
MNKNIFNFQFSIFNLMLLLFASTATGQSGSLGGTTALQNRNGKPAAISQVSLTYQAPPRQKVFQVEDIIYVHVKEKQSYNNLANNQRKKDIETEARITYWSKITGFFKLPVSAGAGATLPEIGAEIDHKTQNQGKLVREENLDFRIACRVASIQDNGNLFIEGTQNKQIGEEGKVIYVGGMIRPDNIGPDFLVESSQISDLKIHEIPSGNVYDTARRPWGTRLLEHWKPF